MPVAIVLAAVVILGGIIVVAMGKGGEMSRERPDLPVRTDFRSWSDVADYRPPAALLGYHAAATERALALIARSIAERDAEIDWLRKRLAEVQPERLSVDDGAELAATELVADGLIAAGLAAETARPAAEPALPGAETALPAELTWQAGSTGPGVTAGYASHGQVSRTMGEDE